jgi:hypothetical protein
LAITCGSTWLASLSMLAWSASRSLAASAAVATQPPRASRAAARNLCFIIMNPLVWRPA